MPDGWIAEEEIKPWIDQWRAVDKNALNPDLIKR